MFKSISKIFYFVYLPMAFLTLFTVYCLFTGIIPLYYLFGTLIMWTLVSGLGIACGYHRVFSHRTHKLPVWKENIILFFATFAGEGSSIFWTALHRGYHHPYADTERDLHSPVVYGSWHAYMGWLIQITENNVTVNVKYAVDLLRKPNHVWFHKQYLRILWGVPLLICLINWQLAFTCFFMVTFIGMTQDNLVNVLGHTKAFFGYRNFDTNDNSQNNIPLAYLTWGQGWHNNHHKSPASYDFGSGISGKWWEFDTCRLFLPFIK